jgi:pimeloyl-ACP methyl ester carboxylesterase
LSALGQALNAAGFATLTPGYPSRKATILELAEGLGADVAAFARQVERLHFVGHSMGGLLARALIARDRPRHLGRVVTMGTPHGGSGIVDLLQASRLFRAFNGPAVSELSRAASAALNAQLGPVDYPLGAIAGTRALNLAAAWFVLPRPSDGTVSVAAAQVAGMAELRLVACDHFFLPRDSQVIALCRVFLTTGRF